MFAFSIVHLRHPSNWKYDVTNYTNFLWSAIRSLTTFSIAFSHALMSVRRALLDESLFGGAGVDMLEVLAPVPMCRAKTRTGRRRNARPERFCSYIHEELVTSTTKSRMSYPALGRELQKRLPNLILLSMGWVGILPRWMGVRVPPVFFRVQYII